MQAQLEKLQGKIHAVTAFTVDVKEKPRYWHYHPEIEIAVVLSGYGSLFAGDGITDFKPGDLFLFGTNLPHDFNIPQDAQARFLVLQFNQDIFSTFKECQAIETMLLAAQRGLKFDSVQHEQLIKLITVHLETPVTLLAQTLLLLDGLSNQPEEPLSRIDFTDNSLDLMMQNRLNKVLSYIQQHIESNISLEHIAGIACMTPPAFCRWFKLATGQRFTAYVNQCRVDRCCHMLFNTDFPITQIAQKSGFESSSHFHRVFTKFKSISPARYRKQLRNRLAV